jgi:hypothetical protein
MAYNDGMINPEFVLDTNGEKMKAAFLNGYTGFWGEYITQDAGYIATLMKNCPTAELSCFIPTRELKMCYLNGMSQLPRWIDERYQQKLQARTRSVEIPGLAGQTGNLNVLQWGIEGKTIPWKTAERQLLPYTGEERLLNGSNKDYYALVIEGVDLGVPTGSTYRTQHALQATNTDIC